MAGYIGSKSSVTQVDGYTRADADAQFIEDGGAITESNGNVGIGTSSPDANLVVYETATSGTDHFAQRWRTQSGGVLSIACSDLSLTNPTWQIRSGSSEPIAFNQASNERMRIDSSGNVGIGTSSPSEELHIEADYPQVRIASGLNTVGSSNLTNTIDGYGTNGRAWRIGRAFGSANFQIINDRSSPIAFDINGTERMRIDASGQLLIGCTTLPDTTNYGSGFYPSSNDRVSLRMSKSTTSSSASIYFYNPNGLVGTIATSGSATSYNTSSDYRLKEDIQPVANAYDRLMQLNPVNFAWKADGSRVDGFIAHEAQEVVPESVTGTKDAMTTEEYEVTPAVEATYDDEGNELTPAVEAVIGEREVPDYQGIDQSKLVPLLTAALQEALTKIESLESRVAALENI
tara:strand:- start:68 stop:1276 length:1209 start_codon:yes stop_codon:yes gene_type:complete